MPFSRGKAIVVALVVLFMIIFWQGPNVQYQPPKRPQKNDGNASEHSRPAFYPGVPKPPGANYSRILVVPKVNEDIRWIAKKLPELQAAIYEVNNPNAQFKAPKNKGHEAMVYLTYIIDHYDDLPDTIIFVHAHESAWHNNFLLDLNTATTIRRLRDDRVARQGYMNLRCHLDPGCPNWIHLDRAKVDFDSHIKPEEKAFSFELFQQMFPEHRPPPVLSQACCAQFAVSRERVRDNPKSTYEHLRNWLLATTLPDRDSGRVFEYIWQYLFTRNAEHCPSMNSCYCDGYGICFGSAKKLDDWLKKLRKRELTEEELRAAVRDKKDKTVVDEINMRVIRLNQELKAEKEEAYKRGEEEENRAIERERLPKLPYT